MAFLIGGANSAADTGYDIENSLRFNDGDSAYLSRTPGSAGDTKKFTVSFWVKRSALGTYQDIFHEYPGSAQRSQILFRSDDTLHIELEAANTNRLVTTRVFRDVSAWYHIVVVYDSDNGTSGNRVILYVNGVRETSFSTETYPSSGAVSGINGTTQHEISSYDGSGYYFDGYMAEFVAIDGLALSPSSFGETDSDSGIWKPIDVSGLTFGTNGFYLSFAGSGVMSATGGDSTDTDGDYKAASFISDGTFTPSDTGYVEYLVIGGGGGGGSSGNGTSAGGGAGGYRTGYLAVTGLTEYSITVGDGGGAGASGDDSIFSTITSNGGGGGGSRSNTEGSRLGKTGGSAGGSAISDGAPLGVTPLVAGNEGGFTPVEGYSGGASADFQGGSNATAALGAGGGGGANASGSAGSGQSGGAGGAGRASSITGSSVTRAGGGGGAAGQNGTLGSGGSGGGGNGGKEATDAVAGTANTGSGGGGCPRTNSSGFGAGGSGIVIIRYKFQ